MGHPTAGSPSAEYVCGDDDARSGSMSSSLNSATDLLTLKPDLTFTGPASHLISDNLVTLISSYSTQQPLVHLICVTLHWGSLQRPQPTLQRPQPTQQRVVFMMGFIMALHLSCL